jgi:hypothetical protein
MVKRFVATIEITHVASFEVDYRQMNRSGISTVPAGSRYRRSHVPSTSFLLARKATCFGCTLLH